MSGTPNTHKLHFRPKEGQYLRGFFLARMRATFLLRFFWSVMLGLLTLN